MRRRTVIVSASAAVVVVAAGATGFALTQTGRDAPNRSGASLPKSTAAVTRGDLVDTKTVDGTLEYRGGQSLVNGAAGTVTNTRDDGTVVTRGHTLYDVNTKPVTLMYGSVPLYRTLRSGVSDGKDVEELERNLADLGYGSDMTVDESFTSATADAIKAWQDDRGLPETGRVDASQVIFSSEAVRITSTKVSEGSKARPGAVMMNVTSTKRKVSIDLDTSDQQYARDGAKVSVELPDGDDTPGKIYYVGKVATKQQGSDSDTITVDVALDHPKQAASLDKAPVSVDLETERHKAVLSVPVEALLALREGGYGVQLVHGHSVRTVSVKTGLFAQGRVEVSGKDLRAGERVGVASE